MTDQTDQNGEGLSLTFEIRGEVDIPIEAAADLSPPNQIRALEEAIDRGDLRLKGYEPVDPDRAEAVREWLKRQSLPDGFPRQGEEATLHYRTEDGQRAAVDATLVERKPPEANGCHELVFDADPEQETGERTLYTVTVAEGAETVRYQSGESVGGSPLRELRTPRYGWSVLAYDGPNLLQRVDDIATLGEFQGFSNVAETQETPPERSHPEASGEPPAPPASE